ncbi:MAG: hypothetical protein ABSA78_09345 [Candidatus Sulfotelmatobacter sp.]|jgi:hypothetical protein
MPVKMNPARRFTIVEGVVAMFVYIADKVKTLFIIGLVIVGLAFAVWWVLPDDSRVKYAAETR